MVKDYMTPISTKKMPIREKYIKKLGTLQNDFCETTPFVWKGELAIFEWVRSGSWTHFKNDVGCFQIFFPERNVASERFAFDHSFGSCHEENGTVYVNCVKGSDGYTNQLDMFWSSDLINWERKDAIITVPEDMCIYNTSVCKGKDGYVMAIEVGTVSGKHPVIGRNYSIIFAKSKDLFDWELLPIEKYLYCAERYTACPSIRYYDGFYYMVYLENAPFHRWIPYIVRTEDLLLWEVGEFNPFMMFDDEDKKVIYPERFTKKEIEDVANIFNCNLSDIDFCDYNGKAVILYNYGNQTGSGAVAVAEYDGSLREFLESYFLK